MIRIAFAVLTWVLCLALLVMFIWVFSWLPMIALLAGRPLMSATVVAWLEAPVARLIGGAATCAWLLYYDSFVWPRRAAELLRKVGF